VNLQRGRPFGEEAWVKRMAKRFEMESTLRPGVSKRHTDRFLASMPQRRPASSRVHHLSHPLILRT
jgi:hypothetical protein